MELSRLKKSLQPSSEDHSSLLDEPEWSLGVIVVESTPRLITVREKTTLELTPTLVHLQVKRDQQYRDIKVEGKNAYTLEGRLAKCVDTIAALVTATTTTFTARSEAVVMTGTKTTTVRPYASKTADTGRTAAAVELRTSAAKIEMIEAAAVMDATSKEDAVTITVVINTMTDEGLTDEDLTAKIPPR